MGHNKINNDLKTTPDRTGHARHDRTHRTQSNGGQDNTGQDKGQNKDMEKNMG